LIFGNDKVKGQKGRIPISAPYLYAEEVPLDWAKDYTDLGH
jgi:hypothetical protein